MSEIEEAINRIKGRVKGLLITGPDGSSVRSTMTKAEDSKLTGYINQLVDKARSVVRDVDPANDMTLLRFTLKRHEILVAPGKNFRIIVLQEINKSEEGAKPT